MGIFARQRDSAAPFLYLSGEKQGKKQIVNKLLNVVKPGQKQLF